MKSKILSALNPVVHQYPMRLLPTPVKDALVTKLFTSKLITALPHHVMVDNDKTWMYYQVPKPTCTSFCLEINLANKAVGFHIGEYEGAYNERNVDSDRTKRPLEKDKVIIKGYLLQRNHRNELLQENIRITFHPSQMVKIHAQVELSSRDRQILFCYGFLRDGYARREALSRLNVEKIELESLTLRGLIKKTSNGHLLTALGEANRLPVSKDNNVAIDQW